MAARSSNDSPSTLIRALRFSISRAKVDPATKALAAALEKALATLLKAVGARNEADDGTLDADAAYDYALQLAEEALRAFHFELLGHFKAKDHKEIARLLDGRTPAQIVKTPKEDKVEVFGGIVTRAKSAKTAREVKAFAGPYAEASAGLAKAAAAVDAAEEALADARETERDAKEKAVVALRRFRGQLTEKFAEDAGRVSRYFLKIAKKSDGDAAPTPAPRPEA